MKIEKHDLIAYQVGQFEMRIIAAPAQRAWMDQTTSSFAKRCLPMRMANQAGWLVLNDRSLRAVWHGGLTPDSVVVEQSGSPPFSAISHFGHGLLTFTMPYLFRTSSDTALLMRGPANSPKDGIGPLEGLVETEWAIATAAMSWKFTRPDTWIEFAKGEPISMIVPQKIALLEETCPKICQLRDDNELREEYEAWKSSRDGFNKRLSVGDREALTQGWQGHYFRGTSPLAGSKQPITARDHRTRLRLQAFDAATES